MGSEMCIRDSYWFSAKAFASLQTQLKNAHFIDATALVNWQRAIKSTTELDYMRTAGKFVERMQKRIVDNMEPGIRKCDLVADIYDAGLSYSDELAQAATIRLSYRYCYQGQPQTHRI